MDLKTLLSGQARSSKDKHLKKLGFIQLRDTEIYPASITASEGSLPSYLATNQVNYSKHGKFSQLLSNKLRVSPIARSASSVTLPPVRLSDREQEGVKIVT